MNKTNSTKLGEKNGQQAESVTLKWDKRKGKFMIPSKYMDQICVQDNEIASAAKLSYVLIGNPDGSMSSGFLESTAFSNEIIPNREVNSINRAKTLVMEGYKTVIMERKQARLQAALFNIQPIEADMTARITHDPRFADEAAKLDRLNDGFEKSLSMITANITGAEENGALETILRMQVGAARSVFVTWLSMLGRQKVDDTSLAQLLREGGVSGFLFKKLSEPGGGFPVEKSLASVIWSVKVSKGLTLTVEECRTPAILTTLEPLLVRAKRFIDVFVVKNSRLAAASGLEEDDIGNVADKDWLKLAKVQIPVPAPFEAEKHLTEGSSPFVDPPNSNVHVMLLTMANYLANTVIGMPPSSMKPMKYWELVLPDVDKLVEDSPLPLRKQIVLHYPESIQGLYGRTVVHPDIFGPSIRFRSTMERTSFLTIFNVAPPLDATTTTPDPAGEENKWEEGKQIPFHHQFQPNRVTNSEFQTLFAEPAQDERTRSFHNNPASRLAGRVKTKMEKEAKLDKKGNKEKQAARAPLGTRAKKLVKGLSNDHHPFHQLGPAVKGFLVGFNNEKLQTLATKRVEAAIDLAEEDYQEGESDSEDE